MGLTLLFKIVHRAASSLYINVISIQIWIDWDCRKRLHNPLFFFYFRILSFLDLSRMKWSCSLISAATTLFIISAVMSTARRVMLKYRRQQCWARIDALNVATPPSSLLPLTDKAKACNRYRGRSFICGIWSLLDFLLSRDSWEKKSHLDHCWICLQ